MQAANVVTAASLQLIALRIIARVAQLEAVLVLSYQVKLFYVKLYGLPNRRPTVKQPKFILIWCQVVHTNFARNCVTCEVAFTYFTCVRYAL